MPFNDIKFYWLKSENIYILGFVGDKGVKIFSVYVGVWKHFRNLRYLNGMFWAIIEFESFWIQIIKDIPYKINNLNGKLFFPSFVVWFNCFCFLESFKIS